ncbi:hypothetical protein ACHAXT_003702 [Thalassiosira profunda]
MRPRSALQLVLCLLMGATLLLQRRWGDRILPPAPVVARNSSSLAAIASESGRVNDAKDGDDAIAIGDAPSSSSYTTYQEESKRYPLTFDDGHGHNLHTDCARDATPLLFEQWLQSKEIICEHGDMRVERYTLQRWESQPAFVVYKNVPMKGMHSKDQPSAVGSTVTTNCTELKRLYDEHQSGKVVATATMNHPVIRVKAFDPFNPYERFHAHLNVAMAMAMFNVTEPQIIDLVSEEHVKYDKGIPQHDMEMYSAFSSVEPMIATHGSDRDDGSVTFVPYMVDAFGSGTSILVTKTDGALRGRGTSHHCKSSIFQGITLWMKSNLLGLDFGEPTLNDKSDANRTIQVAWSSRAPYCCRPKGRTYIPSRPIANEDELVRRVGQALGDRYNITVANFGSLNTHDSVAIAARSRILVGVHGAGLVWASFLPPHSGIVEMFGGDRASNNRHYHNIASLADLHYRSLSLGGQMELAWKDDTVDQIAEKIRSIDFEREPGDSDPER